MPQDPATILVVDDEEGVRATLRRVLGDGYDLVLAESGTEALHLLEVEGLRPHLILLDVRMPGPDGYEVCDRIHQDAELGRIPVVFVTVADTEQDRRRAFGVGAAGYVTKPFEVEELREAVRAHLDTELLWRGLGTEPAEEEREEGDSGPLRDRLSPRSFLDFRDRLVDKFASGAAEEAKRIGMDDPYGLAPLLEMSEEQVARHLAQHLGVDFRPRILGDEVALGALPRAFCRNHLAIPLADDSVVTANPFDQELLEALEQSIWRSAEPSVSISTPSRIRDVFEHRPSAETIDEGGGRILRLERSPEGSRDSEAHRRGNEILRSAILEGASDVHFEPKEDHSVVRFRIDGEMSDVRTLTAEDTARIVSRMKALADLDIAERRKPQDGALPATLGDRRFKLRLATSSTPDGESLVVRILEPDADPVPLDDLGMTERQAGLLRETAGRSQGTILVVGPTGSGKSTTVFTLLSTIDADRRSLLSVEDPVEYTIPKAKQQQVNERAGLTFESLLRSAMRQDPDILFLGEVRDAFSANSVLDFASSGHLTISTLHSADATTAIFRLERLGVERGAMADALSVVVAQKLLRVLCPDCKETGPPTEEDRAFLAEFTDDVPERVARPAGCPSCRGCGYQGRTGVFEVLAFDSQVSKMVREGASVAEIRAFCAERGDLLLADHAIRKIRDLLVPVEDARSQILLEARDQTEPAPDAEEPAGSNEASSKAAPDEGDGGRDEGADRESETPAGEAVGHVLVVEDDRTTRMVLQAYLEKEGYQVTLAEDGVEALMHLGGGGLDVVISDVEMPNVDGVTLLDMIEEKGIEVPVLFVTGSVDDDTEAKLLDRGARDFIRKPVKKDVLIARLRKILPG